MIALFDTFNQTLISKHHSLVNAVKAQRKHLRAIRKHNGKSSYSTYGFAESGDENDLFHSGGAYPISGWKRIHGEEVQAVRMHLDLDCQ